jgi:predicted ATPase
VDIKRTKLEQTLGRTHLAAEEAVPLLAGLLSLPLPEAHYPAVTLSPQEQRQQTQDVLVTWLLEEAERQAVLAVWEDLHWADPSTLETLGLIVDQAPTATMLHVLTFRPEFTPPWPTRSHLTPITLNRLERPQVERLLTRLTGGKTLPSEVVEHIVIKTDGVPLYVEELTKMLLESNLLREEASQYVLTGPLLTVAIPDSLQDSLMARLDQTSTAKGVAQLGAVLGREFSYEMLEAISFAARPCLTSWADAVGGSRIAVPARSSAAGEIPLQTRLNPGCRLCVITQEHATAGAPADCTVVGGALPRCG